MSTPEPAGPPDPDGRSLGTGSILSSPLPVEGGERLWFPEDRLARAERDLTTAAPTAAGGGFRLDPDRARAAADRLTEVINELEATLATWRTDPGVPGIDPVSVRLGENIDRMNGNARAFVRTTVARTTAARDALLAQLEAHRRHDTDAGSVLS
jgi:succinate dehydrogenase/fumarate reductase flavoprotein subunit